MRIDIEHLSVRIGGAELVADATVRAASGQVVGLVGPNGSGKSTLLRCAYRALRPSAGAVLVDGDDLHALSPREGARRLAALPQESSSEFDFTVGEVVAMGRMPHQSATGRVSAADARACAEALATVGAGHLVDRGFLTLSGGEKQRVLIARALAQQPRVLVLDEPTNHLDIAQQLEVLALLRAAPRATAGPGAADAQRPDAEPGSGPGAEPGSGPGGEAGPTGGLTVLTALHDLNLAAQHCDLLYVIAHGRIVTFGPPHEVLTPTLLAEVFQVRGHQVRHPVSGALQLLFDRLPHQSATTVPATR
ncbi:ABC transporter ATP-binding protein [Streptomyces buecherae]|uniref:ABC transporter ATP-binding protein n=1 Tax=Streptomyces buecherae TaxID=2763006 RepID=A0A7H8N7W6_9ACTN|nr:ABC transporter ATP-binding protein [Streptomyces buecherae]QKW50650.1 ABC transporter ATP-binding protein [Streptomyces buecherae]